MFTGSSTLFEVHRHRHPKASVTWYMVSPCYEPVNANDPCPGCGNTQPWLRTESSNGTTPQGCNATTPCEINDYAIIDSFAVLRIGRPTPLQRTSSDTTHRPRGFRWEDRPSTDESQERQTLKSTPIGIFTNSRGEPSIL